MRDRNDRAVWKYYRDVGARVRRIGRAMQRRTGHDAGVPDMIVRYRGAMFFHEVKTPEGELSADQREFQKDCTECGVTCIVGGIREAQQQIERLRNGETTFRVSV